MDVALVEDAEHEVDGEQRGQDEHGLAAERRLEGLRRALEAAVDALRQAEVVHRGV